MPGWHATTRGLVEDGRLIVLGIAPEQHGDRMALFLQWKGMEDMPVMLDSYNLLGLKAVPITLLIDEAGVVRSRDPTPDDLATFLALPPAVAGNAPRAPRPRPQVPAELAHATTAEELSLAVARFRHLVTAGRDRLPAEFHFQRGVAHRKLHDRQGADPEPGHFHDAVVSWRRALAMKPSNYIWRRRLQQYGPRLDKPYPFYDWVETARREIRDRGARPHPLHSEPTGAEIAKPLNGGAGEPGGRFPHPDPDGKLPHDTLDLMLCSAVVVPHTKEPGKAVRVFVTLKPNPDRHARWNDEAGLSTIRLDPPKGWTASRRVIPLPPALRKAERETAPRTVEFELRHDNPAAPQGNLTALTFQVFYNVCHGENRLCQFLRRDLMVDPGLETPRGGELGN